MSILDRVMDLLPQPWRAPRLKTFIAEEKPQVERTKDKESRKKLKANRKKRGY